MATKFLKCLNMGPSASMTMVYPYTSNILAAKDTRYNKIPASLIVGSTTPVTAVSDALTTYYLPSAFRNVKNTAFSALRIFKKDSIALQVKGAIRSRERRMQLVRWKPYGYWKISTARDPTFPSRNVKSTPRCSKLYLEWKLDDLQTIKINLHLPLPFLKTTMTNNLLRTDAFAIVPYSGETAVVIHLAGGHSKVISNVCPGSILVWKAMNGLLRAVHTFLRVIMIVVAIHKVCNNFDAGSLKVPRRPSHLSVEDVAGQHNEKTLDCLISYLSVKKPLSSILTLSGDAPLPIDTTQSDIQLQQPSVAAIMSPVSGATSIPQPRGAPYKFPTLGTIGGSTTALPPIPYQEVQPPFELTVPTTTDAQVSPVFSGYNSVGRIGPEYNAFAEEVAHYGPLIIPNFAEFKNKEPKFSHGHPKNVDTIQQYSAELHSRYVDIKLRTEKAFDVTREWEQDLRGTSECLQVPGAYDPFTSTYNHGQEAHCEQCLAGTNYLEMKTISHVFNGGMYQDLRPLFRLKAFGASHILRKWMRQWKNNRDKKLNALKAPQTGEPFPDFDPLYEPQMSNTKFGDNGLAPMAVVERDFEDGSWHLSRSPFDGQVYAMPKYAPALKGLPDRIKLPHTLAHPSNIPTSQSGAPAWKWDVPFGWLEVATNTDPQKNSKFENMREASRGQSQLNSKLIDGVFYADLNNRASYAPLGISTIGRGVLPQARTETAAITINEHQRGQYTWPYGASESKRNRSEVVSRNFRVGENQEFSADNRAMEGNDEAGYASDTSEESITYRRKKPDFDYDSVLARNISFDEGMHKPSLDGSIGTPQMSKSAKDIVPAGLGYKAITSWTGSLEPSNSWYSPKESSYGSLDSGYKSRMVSPGAAFYSVNIVIGRKRKFSPDASSVHLGSHSKRAKSS